MYAVVGCGECGALWVVEGRPETTGCPRCGTRHRFDALRAFAETGDEAAAKQARAAMLAERQGAGEAFERLESFEEMARHLDEAGVSDAEYLEGVGLDADAVAEAGERSRSGSRSRDEVVRDAIRERDDPTEADVVGYAESHGVPSEAARDLLEKLVRAGEVSESGGRYRLL